MSELCFKQKIIHFNFIKIKNTENFIEIDFKHFHIYENEKYILTVF